MVGAVGLGGRAGRARRRGRSPCAARGRDRRGRGRGARHAGAARPSATSAAPRRARAPSPSLAAFDARSARRALDVVADRPGAAPRARRGSSARGRPHLLLVWRGLLALGAPASAPVEAVVLTVAATLVLLLRADRPLAALAAGALLYVAAARLLEPLRQEVDAPGRHADAAARALGPGAARPHGAARGAARGDGGADRAGCALAGACPPPAARWRCWPSRPRPWHALRRALRRRGGRLPLGVLGVADSDPSGAGGVVVLGWLAPVAGPRRRRGGRARGARRPRRGPRPPGAGVVPRPGSPRRWAGRAAPDVDQGRGRRRRADRRG